MRRLRLVLATLGLFAAVQVPMMSQDRPLRIVVTTPDGLQPAIDAIACGGTIAIRDGLILTPHILLRDQDRPGQVPCTTPTVITREGPLPGRFDVIANCVQVGPSFEAEMAKRDKCWQDMRAHYGKNAPKIYVETTHAQQGLAWALYSDCNANYWTVRGLEIGSRSTIFDPPSYALVFLGGNCEGQGFGYFKHRDQIGHHITFEQMWFHGLTTSIGKRPKDEPASSTRRAILAHADHFVLKDSLLDDFAEIGQDSQAVMVYNAFGPFTFDNIFTDAAGENILFGGADPSRELPGLIPCDITISNSYHTKNWNRWQHGSKVGYTDSPFNYQSKNVFELKNACRVNVFGNVFEASWAYNQNGAIIVHQPVNQDGTCFHCAIFDVDQFSNIVRWGAEAMSLAGKSGYSGGSAPARNIKFRNSEVYGLRGMFGPPSSDPAYPEGGGGTAFSLISGSGSGSTHDPFASVHITGNTIINDGQVAVVGNCGDTFTDFKLTDNLVRAAKPWYDAQMVFCASGGGKAGFDLYMPGPGGWEVERNVIATDGGHASPWPASNTFLKMADYPGLFMNFAAMNYRLKLGSPYVGRGANFTELPGGTVKPIVPIPPSPCTYTVGPTTVTIPAQGGPIPLTVASSAASCPNPVLSTSEPWLTLGPAWPPVVTAGSHANTTPRTGTVLLVAAAGAVLRNAGPAVTVTQAAFVPPTPACTATDETFHVLPAGGRATNEQWDAFIAAKRDEGYTFITAIADPRDARGTFRRVCP